MLTLAASTQGTLRNMLTVCTDILVAVCAAAESDNQHLLRFRQHFILFLHLHIGETIVGGHK